MFDNYGQNQAAPAPAPAPKQIIRFDKGYVKTKEGILKVIQIACNFIGFICIKISTSWVSPILYNLLYWIGNIVTLLLLLFYTFHFVEKFERIPWAKYEFFFCTIMSLAYIGCSIFAATLGESVGYAVGFFGLCAIFAYGFDAYLKYKAWKRGLPAQ